MWSHEGMRRMGSGFSRAVTMTLPSMLSATGRPQRWRMVGVMSRTVAPVMVSLETMPGPAMTKMPKGRCHWAMEED